MIAVIKPGTTEHQLENLVSWLEGKGLEVNISKGSEATIVGLIGDTSRVDVSLLESMGIIESVTRVTEPFKAANRKFHPMDTKVEIAPGVAIGAGEFQVMAGPCSVEGQNLFEIARAVRAAGATVLRGGAFKPRTSPYANQGMGEAGLDLLCQARAELGMPIVTEIMDVRQVPLFLKYDIDLWQIGARNTQNFNLLKEVGRAGKPVLLKRGLAGTIDELLMSAEYIMSEGNSKVILCERGIRTFETATRNTLDLSAVPVLHNLSHLPVVVDPSHATGKADLVAPMAYAATAAGADGIMVEVHNDPAHALCDGAQSITPPQFDEISRKVRQIREVLV